jgi:hypothetical protein
MAGNQGDAQLFLLRLWLEEDPQAEMEAERGEPNKEVALRWQGKVQHVVRGEAHAFNGWEMLIGWLEDMMMRDRIDSA